MCLCKLCVLNSTIIELRVHLESLENHSRQNPEDLFNRSVVDENFLGLFIVVLKCWWNAFLGYSLTCVTCVVFKQRIRTQGSYWFWTEIEMRTLWNGNLDVWSGGLEEEDSAITKHNISACTWCNLAECKGYSECTSIIWENLRRIKVCR